MSAPICSVCIANFNGENTLAACLDSVLTQDFEGEVEILVHDDASTDGSLSLLRSRYPQIVVIKSAENVGFCIANNRMAERASGQFLLLLNNDAALRPGALSALLQRAATIAGYAVLTLPQYALPEGILMDRGSLFDPFLNPVPNLDENRTQIGMGMGACLWVPKTLWNEIGGMPEWFGSLAEDMYLCLSARKLGYPVEVVQESGYDHWVGASFGGGKAQNGRLSTTYRRRALSERNKTYVMVLFYPLYALLLLLPLHVFLLVAEGAALSCARRSAEPWRRIYGPCLLAVWNARAHLLRERSRWQKSRATNFFSPFTAMPWKLRMLLRHGLPALR